MAIPVLSDDVVVRDENFAIGNGFVQPSFTEGDNIWITRGSICTQKVEIWNKATTVCVQSDQ